MIATLPRNPIMMEIMQVKWGRKEGKERNEKWNSMMYTLICVGRLLKRILINAFE
jgi:hypothetical protein